MASDARYLEGFATGTAHALDLVRQCLGRDLDPVTACDTVQRVCDAWVQAERLGVLLTGGHPVRV